MKKTILAILSLFPPLLLFSGTPSDSLLLVLKNEIRKKQIYDAGKEEKLQKLRKQLAYTPSNSLNQQYDLCNRLYWEYKDYIFDSAHVYTNKLLKLSNQLDDLPKRYESQIKLATIQVSCSMFKEAFDGIHELHVDTMDNSLKFRYYELKAQAFTRLSIYNTSKFYSPAHHAESLDALRAAMQLAEPGSYERLSYTASLYHNLKNDNQAIAHYRQLLHRRDITNHQKAMVAHDLSSLTGDSENRSLITLAAIYDIRSSTKETLAIFSLGSALLKEGKLEDAELLLNEALSQSKFYGNRLHHEEVATALKALAAEKLIRIEANQNRTLTILIAVLASGIIITGITFIVVYRKLQDVKRREAFIHEQNLQLDLVNKKLVEDASIKEEYIGYFFQLISGYILKLEKLKRLTEKVVRSESYKELPEIAKSINIKQERATLYKTFDSIFLKLFPNFIPAFNSMFTEEDRIVPKKNEVLNTNLRIFALMRLGIKDSQTIATILETTVNTIYTYKFRTKSKALIQGDQFDKMIMDIKFNNENSQLP